VIRRIEVTGKRESDKRNVVLVGPIESIRRPACKGEANDQVGATGPGVLNEARESVSLHRERVEADVGANAAATDSQRVLIRDPLSVNDADPMEPLNGQIFSLDGVADQPVAGLAADLAGRGSLEASTTKRHVIQSS
jgi:hypothetical protein